MGLFDMDPDFIRAHFIKVQEKFGPQKHSAVPIFESAICYPMDQVAELARISGEVLLELDEEKWPPIIERFKALQDHIQKLPDAPEPIMLWPEGKMPAMTVYTENPGLRYNHDPDFKPYMMEVLVPEDVMPKGAVVVCPGGDHGDCTVKEGYQVCFDLRDQGYQCFMLANRPNHNPWCQQDCGVDAARAIRYIRAHAKDYRIPEDRVAFAGFSNGGVTGEACIQYYSGTQTVKDQFPEYEPDELDAYYGAPDAFLCIYGPRFDGAPFDYEKVVYPPTFFAVGRLDTAMQNLHYVYPDLVAHGVPVEVHTFAGTPHGEAGAKIIDGIERYPNFNLWVPLADAFMQDAYKNR